MKKNFTLDNHINTIMNIFEKILRRFEMYKNKILLITGGTGSF